MNISSYITDAEKMTSLVDYFVFANGNKTILDMIYKRQLPKLVYQDISLVVNNFDEKILEKFKSSDYNIMKFTVGYVGGKKNPLSKISFYNFKVGTIISENKIKNFSLLINQIHQEHFTRI